MTTVQDALYHNDYHSRTWLATHDPAIRGSHLLSITGPQSEVIMNTIKVGDFPKSGMIYIPIQRSDGDWDIVCSTIEHLQTYKNKYPGKLVITASETAPVYFRTL
jgi:hypothetical protein